MRKSLTIITLLCACIFCSCGDDKENKPDTTPKDETCETLNCTVDGALFSKTCVVIDGEAQCKDECLGDKAGTLDPICHYNGSLPPDGRTNYAVLDTCALDDNGKLYSKSKVQAVCNAGCTNGYCDIEEDDSDCEDLDCLWAPGAMYGQTCVVIDGKAQCKESCLGGKVGENAPTCVSNSSIEISLQTPYSVVDTCVADDNGDPYSSRKKETKCEAGCDNETGTCL